MAIVSSNIFIGSSIEKAFIGTDLYDPTAEPTFVGIVTGSDSADDRFGNSVAVGSGKIVVGASNENVDGASDQGAVYIFDLDGNEVGVITAFDGTADDFFGNSVAVGNDRIVIGAHRDDNPSNLNGDQGSVYIYDLNRELIAKIFDSNGNEDDRFGNSVAVGSGRIVVGVAYDRINGNYHQGSVSIYDLYGNEVGILTASDGAVSDEFGWSVAVGSGRIVVGAPYSNNNGSNSGSVYIYDLDKNEVGIITASDGAADDQFGYSVAVGNGRIVVGARYDDNNGSNSGSVYIYDLDGNEVGILTASDGAADDEFGNSVAVGSGRIVVGAYDSGINGKGAVYIYDLDGNEVGILTASDGAPNDEFGKSVAVGEGKIVAGSPRRNSNSVIDSGAIYIYNTQKFDHVLDILDK